MMEQSSPSISEINPSPAIGGCSKRRPRKPISCEPCRRSKLRCDRQLPCGTCLRRGWQGSCTYDRTQTGPRHKPSRRRVPPAAATESNPQAQSRATQPLELASPRNQSQSQSPGPMESRWDAVLRRPTTERNEPVPIPADVPFTLSFGPSIRLTELLAMLPPNSVCEYLVSRYFVHLSPLFHILHGPAFQRQYSSFVQDPLRVDLSWLALPLAICSSTLKTIEPGDPVLAEPGRAQYGAEEISSLSQRYRDAAMMSLSQDQFLVRHNLNTLEALLILIHTISHSDGAEHGWALLGNALNIAIALRCHTDTSERSYIEKERRRRCWAGVLILHTYQALLFRDVDISYLLNIKATMPTAVNDNDIQGDAIITSNQQPSSQLTGMSLMNFQIRLLYLSTRICRHISGPNRLNEELLRRLDSEILEEQGQWDSVYLVDGAPSILDTARYAHWRYVQV